MLTKHKTGGYKEGMRVITTGRLVVFLLILLAGKLDGTGCRVYLGIYKTWKDFVGALELLVTNKADGLMNRHAVI